MSKLAWVLLPAVVLAALLVLRRRPLSRPVLNVAFSLLLLAYLGTTAGLGLFWVANQQLPAFDWHYLFGYVTLALLVLHLAFSLPTVWRVLWSRAAAARPSAAAPRRPLLLAGLAATAAAGLGYVVGLRHGRVELHLGQAGAAPVGSGSADAGRELVEAFHALSSHQRRGVLRRTGTAEWGDAPPPFKRYGAAERIALPPAGSATPRSDGEADLAVLADLLWHCAGVSLVRGGIHFRTAPSSGALFATELYLWADRPAPLQGRWWHYDGAGHALVALPAVPEARADLATADAGGAGHALIVATALFARSGHKYGDRTWRYVLADAGHALQNLLLVARGLGVPARLAAQFDDSALGRALGLDAQREGVLALVGFGPLDSPARPLAQAPTAPMGDAARAARATDNAAELTTTMHAASSLPGAGLVWRDMTEPKLAAVPVLRAASEPVPARLLPAPHDLPADIRALIAERRSVRRYAPRPLTPRQLSTLLAAARGAAAASSPALGIDVVTLAVAGLPAAAWSYQAAGLVAAVATAPGASELRTRAGAAGLDQEVIGGAAVVLALSLERSALGADPLGMARAYRHAFIEAGLAGERVYLAAAMLGLGCCGVGAFYDDEVAALIGRDPARFWIAHLVAVGALA